LHGGDDFRVQVTGVQYRDTAGEVDELTAFNVGNGSVLRVIGEDRVNLTNATRNSGFTAFHQGCVCFAHGFLIHRSSGGVVQGSSSGGQQRQHTMIDCRGLPATKWVWVPQKPAGRRSRAPQVEYLPSL
jgi:hypothetical protein